MRILFLLIAFLYLNADELQITKYITNEKPKIYVEYTNINHKLLHTLKLDTTLIAHYNMDIGKQINDFRRINIKRYKGYNYLLRLNYQHKQLTALLYNLISRKVEMIKRYRILNFNSYPFMVHSLSYDINSKLGFEAIPWIKRKIVYSVNMAPKESAIFIADITLTYRKKIIAGGLNIFPKWANKEQTEIYYTKYLRVPTLFKYNIRTGVKTRITSSNGMLVVSDVDFKNNRLLLTLAPNDQPDIYEFNLNDESLNRITNYNGIDVNGQFYGNNSVLYISNILGKPNVYQKNLDTGMVKKVLHYQKNQVSVTAHNDNVIISSRETDNSFAKNTFNLLLINKNSGKIRRLTFGGKNIQPVFSNDGSTLLFIKENNFNSKIGILRLKENIVFYFKLSKIIQSFDY